MINPSRLYSLLFVSVFSLLSTGWIGAKTYVVAQGDPKAGDEGEGTAEAPFKTISKAASVAGPGDTVTVHAGIYRERVTPAKGGTGEAPVIYQAAKGESVSVKGSDIWTPEWKAVDEAEKIREGILDAKMFPEANPYLTTISVDSSDKSVAARPAKDGVFPETLGQVFVGGQEYYQATSMESLRQTDGSWMVNEKGDGILVNFRQDEADDAVVEISVRNRIFCPARRGLSHITVRGFTFEHCANQGPFPQGGAVSVRSGRDWVIEGNTIRHAKTIGLDCGSEFWEFDRFTIPTAEEDKKLIIGGGHMIRGNTISDNGLCGIAGWNHKGTMVIENVIERNNNLGFPRTKGWEEWAAIKFHNSDALIAGNLIRDNEAHGIWIDNGYTNAHITRNVIINNYMSGVFLELGTSSKDRVLISNNVIAYTRSDGGFFNGSGIYTHDASDIDISHNLVTCNAGYGITQRAITPREHGGGIAGASRNRITNNILDSNVLGQLSLPAVSDHSHGNASDHNLFLGRQDFNLNRYFNTFSWEKLTAAFAESLAARKVPETSRPDLATFSKRPVMNLESWQALWDMDRSSLWVKDLKGGGFRVRPRIPELAYPATAGLAAMKCPPHPGVTEDFFGNPVSSETVIPGPFQHLSETPRLIALRTTILNPSIKTTDTARQERMQAAILAEADAIPKPETSGEPRATFDALAGKDAGTWFTAGQSASDPEFTSPYGMMKEAGKTISLYQQGKNGPSSSPSGAVFFKAPEDGWYAYDIAAEIGRREGVSAGFTRAELFIINDKLSAAKSLGKFDLNTPDGHRGKELAKGFETKGETALKKGWHLALRFQIVSPGPAPGGNGDLNVTRFKVTQN